MKRSNIISLMLAAAWFVTDVALGGPGVYNVRDFGALGDGKALDTAAINKAIEACATAGGGQVLLPSGTYLSGTVVLKSNVMLHLDSGTRLLGTPDLSQYTNFVPPAGSFEARSPQWQRALVLISEVENAGISGEGTIDGNKVRDPKGEEQKRGPHALVVGKSRNITLRDVQFKDASNYAMLIEWTDQVDIQNVTATGGWDGVHMRHCKGVVITDCHLYTGDDAIAGRFWENVLITKCVLNSSCNGIRVIGPARHLIIQNCLIYGPGLHPHITTDRYNLLAGVYFQPGSWDPSAGELDDVLISDITMRNPATPFRITIHKNNKGGDIVFSRISATGVYRGGILLESNDDPIQRVALRDINIEYSKDDKKLQAEHRSLAAWGLSARNLKTLQLDNVRLSALERDARPMMTLDDIEKVTMNGLRFPPTPEGPSIVMNNVRRQEMRDAGAELIEVSCEELTVVGLNGTDLVAGKPYSATATITNGAKTGLGKVELQAGEHTLIRWIWLKPNEKKKVVFAGIKPTLTGHQELRCGTIQRHVNGPSTL